MKSYYWCLIFCLFSSVSNGQIEGTQIWGDYTLNYPFSSIYVMKYNGAYKTAFGSEDWKSIDSRVIVERAFGSHTDVHISGFVSYKKQTATYNTLEFRPTLGVRYHINPNRRNPVRIFLRYEWRHVQDLEDKEWTNTNRLRLRPELLVPINGSNIRDDKLWYGKADVEWFANLDQDQEERFANRFRTRLGIGYRRNYSWRFEFIYILQQARDTIEEEFKGSDNIFFFRVKQYLRKSK